MSVAWTQQEAIVFCTLVEEIAPAYGCHVALTGGCLYKRLDRKDLDVVLYRIRQKDTIERTKLFEALSSKLALYDVKHINGWITKAKWANRSIDFFFPEEDQNTSSEDTEYPDDN
jgi:hypothetical protein